MPAPDQFRTYSLRILIVLSSGALYFFPVPCLAQSRQDSLREHVALVDPDTIKDVPSRLTEYEPNYIVGNFTQNYFGQVKFQLSLKFDLNIKSEKYKLYFALSELVFWDLYRRSAPMKELDFKPILFY